MPRKKNLNFETQLKLLASRQIDERYAAKAQSRLQVTETIIKRLGLEAELEGHDGCVNCLEWNECGTLLLSASDDVHFIIWAPLHRKKILTFDTGHRGNIFTVKFLPFTNDHLIATGAGDCKVRIHELEKCVTTSVCSCHTGRVKRIATAPNIPSMFWSAGEDGLIMEFDLRSPHACSKQLNNILINLSAHLGRSAEAKCLAVNPCRPEQLAVGANDPFVRLYDRRMIRPVIMEAPSQSVLRNAFERYQFVQTHAENNLTDESAQYFVAGHLPNKLIDDKKKFRPLSTTYLTFSPSGTELLVNLGGEQIYLFDINNRRKIKSYDLTKTELCNYQTSGHTKFNYVGSSNKTPYKSSTLIDNLEMSGNSMSEMQMFNSAIREFNEAVSLCSNAPGIYGSRAAAFMKRGWDGDMYAALRDCYQTIELDPNHVQAYFRLAKCLFELDKIEDASKCLSDFQAKFPDQAHSVAAKALAAEIGKAQEKQCSQSDKCSSDSEDDERPSHSERASKPNSALISDQEQNWRNAACDYEYRFCGHCNTTTDIKEANFFGREGQYIVAGSDDGSFFIWDRHTTNIVQIIKGDESIVNCLQPHPTSCVLATSGIDPVVRIWAPLPEDGRKNERAVSNLDDAASANQKRMNSDPFELMLLNMGYRIPSGADEDDLTSQDWSQPNLTCRSS